MGLKVIPTGLKAANEYVARLHRHNKPASGHKFSIGAAKDGQLVGVCICGKPVARYPGDGKTLEVRRVCTDGTRNACSILYGAAARIAREMGYGRIITYTLQSEPGTSLKASGWKLVCEAGGRSWNTPSRPREAYQESLFGMERKYSGEPKYRWERILSGADI
jgi:hypothetical protein